MTLVYELLDAHLDTIDLAGDRDEVRWRAHLDYLRALQRGGSELLAAAEAHEHASCLGATAARHALRSDHPQSPPAPTER